MPRVAPPISTGNLMREEDLKVSGNELEHMNIFADTDDDDAGDDSDVVSVSCYV